MILIMFICLNQLLVIGQPKMQNDSGSFVNSFYFCTFNEGYSMSDLEAYQKALNNTEGFSDYWWYATLEPTFEPADPKPDFVWVDIWRSSADESLLIEIIGHKPTFHQWLKINLHVCQIQAVLVFQEL